MKIHHGFESTTTEFGFFARFAKMPSDFAVCSVSCVALPAFDSATPHSM